MSTASRFTALCLAMSLLAACGNPSAGAPGAVSEGEAKALEEAAQMLDERRLPEGALPPVDPPIDARNETTDQSQEGPNP